MAVDTPVLERRTSGLMGTPRANVTVPARSEYEAEDEHNARIKDNYAKLINPDNRIEDIFDRNGTAEAVAQQPVQEARTVAYARPVQSEPYLVRNARADAAIFRADNPLNRRFLTEAAPVAEQTVAEEEDDEDLRPTPATIQYRTIDRAETETAVKQSARFALTKKQKITAIALVAVIVTLIALIIINSTIIANLNADITNINSEIININSEIEQSITQITDKINRAQNGIDTLRGATAGINPTMNDLVRGVIG